MHLKKDYLAGIKEDFWLLNTDTSPLFRPYSPTLPQRRYVYKPNNQVKGNKPVDVGYELSCVGLSARRSMYGKSEGAWNLPLSMRLIPYDSNKNSFAANQVNNLLDDKELPFGSSLTVNALDSNYASPEYIGNTYGQANLVNVIRLASNRKVWKQLDAEEQEQRRTNNPDRRGATAIYGRQYKLNQFEDWNLPDDEVSEFGIKLGNGKAYVVRVVCWNNMLVRTKRGLNMKDKPFRLIRIELLDPQTQQAIFKRPMWLSAWGKRAHELSLESIFWAYRHRFDMEHFFRFGKQKLLLDKYQTPDEEHLDSWLDIVNLAYWLLWAAHQEAQPICPKWQSYDPKLKQQYEFGLKPTPSQVQRQMEGIILSFDQQPFLPKLQIKGQGREPGKEMEKRPRYPIRKKE